MKADLTCPYLDKMPDKLKGSFYGWCTLEHPHAKEGDVFGCYNIEKCPVRLIVSDVASKATSIMNWHISHHYGQLLIDEGGMQLLAQLAQFGDAPADMKGESDAAQSS